MKRELLHGPSVRASIGSSIAREGTSSFAKRIPKPETSIWNDYWHFDRLSSFDNDGRANYGEEIASGWRAFFDSLPHGASILDLCTGNGAVAVMAAEASRRNNKHFRIVAADSADINPCLYVKSHRDELAGIEFWPGTPAESLPWPDACFDAVISQFGIEYSDFAQSMPELARVIAPAGQARLFLHAAEGAVVQKSNVAITEIDFLLHQADLAGKAQHCLRAAAAIECKMDRSASALCEASASRDAFHVALQETAQRMATAIDPAVLRNSGQMLDALYRRRGQYDLAQLIGIVEGIRTEWRNHRSRLAAQMAAAVNRDQRAELAEKLRRLGATQAEESDQIVSGSLIGHCIEAIF